MWLLDNNQVTKRVLVLLKHLILKKPCIGPHLVQYYREILSQFNRYLIQNFIDFDGQRPHHLNTFDREKLINSIEINDKIDELVKIFLEVAGDKLGMALCLVKLALPAYNFESKQFTSVI